MMYYQEVPFKLSPHLLVGKKGRLTRIGLLPKFPRLRPRLPV
jgi:hypothetical protein